ncbi:site-specific integrase [Streptomyces sp. NPDC056159]|uniref:site-specific integrase n=1 Tax=Streptomyces sp. NPDC056159 TaxID=3155537 RepID=UPI0034469F1E
MEADPTIGIERRPAPPDRTKALSKPQITALWQLDASVREKTFWKLLYQSAARADEILCLNIEELCPADKRGRVISKGGAIEWIHWQSGTAQLLPRLIAGRTHGPHFLADRKAPARTPTLDTCPVTGRARLSYRRAEEIFEENTRLLANLLATPEDFDDLEGWTLHRLRHSTLTHDAEDGTSTPMLLAHSRHASVRSLERYARPGVDAVAQHVAERDPAARRRARRCRAPARDARLLDRIQPRLSRYARPLQPLFPWPPLRHQGPAEYSDAFQRRLAERAEHESDGIDNARPGAADGFLRRGQPRRAGLSRARDGHELFVRPRRTTALAAAAAPRARPEATSAGWRARAASRDRLCAEFSPQHTGAPGTVARKPTSSRTRTADLATDGWK